MLLSGVPRSLLSADNTRPSQSPHNNSGEVILFPLKEYKLA